MVSNIQIRTNSINPVFLSKKEKNTEEIILKSARKVFLKKGLQGARMQDIADKARINKAMLHYYYKSKEKLFEEIFTEETYKLLPQISELLESDIPLFDKIKFFVGSYLDVLKKNKNMPIFVLNEITQNHELIVKLLKDKINSSFGVFASDVSKAVKAGEIKGIEASQLLVNMISLSVFPFAARPMIKGIYGMSEEDFDRFIEIRKKEVPEFIINAIKVK